MNDLKEIGFSPQRPVTLIVGEGLSFRPSAQQYIHSHHRYLVFSTSSSSIHRTPTPTTPQNQHKAEYTTVEPPWPLDTSSVSDESPFKAASQTW
jgi:hypothetical protein